MKSYKSLMAACAMMTMVAGAGVAVAQRGMDLKAALADPIRPDADKARDADRKPAELIAFSGVKAGDKIAELAAGGGYFTRILTAAVGPTGRVYAFMRPNPTWEALGKARPNLTPISGNPAGTIPVPEKVDVVWTTMNYHDFANGKMPDGSSASAAYNKAAFDALKPGGIYFISDHEAGPNAAADVTSTLHRIGSDRVRKEVEAAGFKFEEASKLLAHDEDHKARVMETGIRGKTDQFAMRFRKPK